MNAQHSSYPRMKRQMDTTNDHSEPYPDIAMEVVRISDIVLEICDARFIKEVACPASF